MNCNPCCGCFPPITTYNPSVADNFPTILQQVEYLKALLKKYPSQQWFITQEKVTEETVKLDSTKVSLRGRAIAEGDFILGNKVIENDDGTFTTVAILMFQYTGAMADLTYYVVEYVGVYTNQEVAEQALSLAQTNEKDIATLDGEVAVLETNIKNAIYVGSDKQELTREEYERLTKDVSAKIRRGTSTQRIYHFFAFSNGVYIYVSTGGSQSVPPTGLYAMKVYKDNNGMWCEYIGGFDFAVLGKTVEVYNNKTLVIAGKPSTNVYTINVDGDFASGFTGLYFPAAGGHALVKEQLKTIFGNQTLVGSGNIDLYRHTIYIKQSSRIARTEIYINYYSSNNLVVNSLTDLKTLIKEFSGATKVSCSGQSGKSGESQYPVVSIYAKSGNLYFEWLNGDLAEDGLISDATVTDTVTTI